MTNNSLSEDIYAVGQLMADNLNSVGVSDADVDDGLTTLANKILNASGGKTQTILTLNTPLVVYTDKFNVTGVLTDNEDNPIEGATIQLIWNDGSEHIATGATNSSGVFSFTSTDPASVSQYSFQLFFAGDNDYAQSSSSVVNVNTAKETSVLVITSPASGAVVSTDSVAVSGTAKDNDNTPLTGKNVYFLLNGSSAGSTTVGSDGSFSKTVSGLSAGSNSIRCDIAATTTHTAASQSITVNRVTFDGLADLELIDGSQILSYADEQSTPGSQYATLEAQLTNGGSPAAISGVEIEFWDFTDDTSPVLLHSDYTEPDGTVSYTYESVGRGDVPIKAKVGSFLTKTFVVYDYWKYIDSVSKTFSSTSVEWFNLADLGTGLGDCEITFKMKANVGKSFRVDLSTTNQYENKSRYVVGVVTDPAYKIIQYYNASGTENVQYYSTYSVNTDVTGIFHRENGNMSISVDNNTYTYTDISNLRYIGIVNWNIAKTVTITDLKVKPL